MKFYPFASFAPALVAGVVSLLVAGCDRDKAAVTSSSPTSAITSPSNTRTVTPTTAPAPTATGDAVVGGASAPMVAEAPQPPAPPEAAAPMRSPSASASSETVATAAPTPAGSLAAPNAQPTRSNVDGWEEIKDYTYAQKTELVARVEAMIADLDNGIAAVRGSSPKPELADTRSADLAALDNSRAVLIQKRDALQYASAETWQSSKTEFRSAWRGISSDYAKLKAASN